MFANSGEQRLNNKNQISISKIDAKIRILKICMSNVIVTENNRTQVKCIFSVWQIISNLTKIVIFLKKFFSI